jgi:hypothetical protein
MQAHRIAALLRQGFLDVAADSHLACEELTAEPALSGLKLAQLVDEARSSQIAPSDRDRRLLAVVRCYRRGPASFWGPVLLEMLAPALVLVSCSSAALPRAVDSDDIDQQVVIHALEAAASIPLPDPPDHLERRLFLRCLDLTHRWLRREMRRQGTAVETFPLDRPEWQEALFELADLSDQPLTEVARQVFEGKTDAAVAAETGVGPDAVWRRRRRILATVRRATLDRTEPGRAVA